MRVFDLIMYNQEADMLDVRLSHLGDVVDKFIIVEGNNTFQQNHKPVGLAERHQNHPKISYHVFNYDGVPGWPAEWAQRDSLFTYLRPYNPQPDDIVIVADCDEIWQPKDLDLLQFGWYGWVMKRTVMSMYWQLPEEHTAVGGPWGKRPGSAQACRGLRYGLPILRSGWHLSWMGGPEWAANKMREFCHQELMVQDPEGFMAENYRIGRSIRNEVLVEGSLEESMPQWIRDGKAPESWYRLRQ